MAKFIVEFELVGTIELSAKNVDDAEAKVLEILTGPEDELNAHHDYEHINTTIVDTQEVE